MKLPQRHKNGSRFGELIAERIAVAKQLRALDTIQSSKLTGPAFLKAALKIADSTPEQLQKLRQQLEPPAPAADGPAASVLRRMVVAVRSLNYPGPPADPRRWAGCFRSSDDLGAIVSINSTPLEIAALAVLICTERHPDCFGQNESIAAHSRRLLDLSTQIADLDQQIKEAIGPADWYIAPEDKATRPLVTVRLDGADTGVPLNPIDNVAERLVNWMIANESKVVSG